MNVMELAHKLREGKIKPDDVPKEVRTLVDRLAGDRDIPVDRYVKGRPGYQSDGSGRFQPASRIRAAK